MTNQFDPQEVEEASVSATGRSWFDVTYELDQETAFSFELDIARLDETEISFSATNTSTGEVVFSLTTADTDTRQEISMTGILDAGEYKFALDCLTDSSIDSHGGLNLGGQAIFDLSLDLEEEYVQVWVPEQYETSSGYRLAIWDLLDFDASTPSSPAAVPEPNILTLLTLGAAACLLCGRRRRI